MDLQIVPVGLNYSEHRNCRNIIHVNYGKAIPVKDFEQEFKEDEIAATQHMKEVVSEAMKKLVFHVPVLEEYPFHKILWDTLETDQSLLTDASIVNKRINKASSMINDELISKANELILLAENYNVELKEAARGKKWGFKDILLFPFYVFSFLNNIIPYQPVRHLTTKVIKDHAFDASIKFLTGLFILPAFYGITALILYLSGVHPNITWTYVALSFITAPLFIRAKELFALNSAQKLKKFNPDVYNDILEKLETFKKLRLSILNE